MERVMSVEERIRRAEDIYNRRNGQYSKVGYKGVKGKKVKKRSIAKKMLMQMFVCLMIYICFYATINSEYIFSKEFRDEMQTKFSVESFQQMFVNVKEFLNKNVLKKEVSEEDSEQKNNINSEIESNIDETNENNITNNEINNEEGIGGSEENKKDNSEEEVVDEETQMKKDAEYIKSKISFIVPVQGTISSTFGWRNPTTNTVPKNHTGLDIAAIKGTVIKSATDGVVTLVSTQGDYGYHYYIKIDDITIIYAHCSKLYLNEGDVVKQGQEIAEVGSTGNSTRTTFTF